MPSVAEITIKELEGPVHPDWCPGCGDFGVLKSVKEALVELKIAPHDVLVVSGIGCSSNLPGFIRCYGVHSLHGRSLPVATGAALANHELTVLAVGGDGDGFGIGMGHFIHSVRRNPNLTYVVMDNEIYGLTTGQTSPTTMEGHKTKSTPKGNIEKPVQPLALALAAGATYVARGFSGDQKHLTTLIRDAIAHRGFSLVDVFSPCVTFNKINTYAWFKERVYRLEDEEGYDPSDFGAALDKAFEFGDRIPLGCLYRAQKPSYQDRDNVLQKGPLVKQKLGLSRADFDAIMAENT